jgi:hypothetical protein
MLSTLLISTAIIAISQYLGQVSLECEQNTEFLVVHREIGVAQEKLPIGSNSDDLGL